MNVPTVAKVQSESNGNGFNKPRNDADDVPEHRGERRRFLIWALMLGAAPPERVVERVVAELEEDER